MAAPCIGTSAGLRFCLRFRSLLARTPVLLRKNVTPTCVTSHVGPSQRVTFRVQSASGNEGRGSEDGGNIRGVLWAALAFSFFRSHEDEPQTKYEELILLLKKAKLNIYREKYKEASDFLHQAVFLAHQTQNQQAIVYTYSLMANLAYVQGQLEQAEKLFKAAMQSLLSGGRPLDDNAVIEMSLKLACIYGELNRAELAELGFTFCVESLETKLQKQAELPAEQRTEEQEVEGKETRLLLGLCLDSRSRYRVATKQRKEATHDLQRALEICRQEQGETHPQTLVLMNDLATLLDLRGLHDEALVLSQRAVDLSRSNQHPDLHVLLVNLAGILMHKGLLDQSVRLYREALNLSQQLGDQEAVDQIQDGLKEVKRRREETNKETDEDTE